MKEAYLPAFDSHTTGEDRVCWREFVMCCRLMNTRRSDIQSEISIMTAREIARRTMGDAEGERPGECVEDPDGFREVVPPTLAITS